jgi:hypothetical protein
VGYYMQLLRGKALSLHFSFCSFRSEIGEHAGMLKGKKIIII